MSSNMIDTALAWMLTYAVHSTLLLGGGWLVVILLGRRRLAIQEALLRAALLGGLLTASLQVGLGPGPVRVDLRPAATTRMETPAAPRLDSRSEVAAVGPTALDARPGYRVSAATTPHRPPRPGVPWRALFLTGWCLGAGLGAVRLALSDRRLRALLRDRRPLPAGRLIRRLAQALGLRRPVRVSLSRRIAVPFAVGWRRPEVCLPERALDGLAPVQREALFAHELAHHARRDPAWLVVYRLLEALLFFQPLNRRTRARLQELAECRCDDAAVLCTGRRLDLARCLVEVAQWTRSAPTPAPVAALSTLSGLGRRVERLLARQHEGPGGRWLLPALAVAALVLAVALPGFDLAATRPAEAAVSAETAPQPTVTPGPPPAPPAPPQAPVPAAAPLADLDQLEQEVDRLAAEIDARMERHSEEMEKLEAEIEALAAEVQPKAEELQHLAEEIGKQAEEQHAALAGSLGEDARRQAEERVRDLGARIRELTARWRPSEEEIRRLTEKARVLAEASRPSPEQLQELKAKAHEKALEELEAQHGSREEIERLSREVKEKAREAARAAREAARSARVEAKEKAEELRRLLEEEKQKQPTPQPGGGG